MSDEWGDICNASLTPSTISHKTLINYGGRRMVTGAAAEEMEYEETEKLEEE